MLLGLEAGPDEDETETSDTTQNDMFESDMEDALGLTPDPEPATEEE